jgi:DNA-binding MarR family transcriptional regulator
MTTPPFLLTIRELVCCYQAFEVHSAAQIRQFGLTPPQFDVIATLGNTQGMTPKELVEKTLITKGTLTGIVDRLEARGLVRRVPSPTDGRSQIVQLTKKGVTLFNKVFPLLLAYMGKAFAGLSAKDYARIDAALRDLHSVFKKRDGDE